MCNAGAASASASAALSDVKASAAVALRNGPEVGHIITESCMHQGDAQQCQVGWHSYQGEARLSKSMWIGQPSASLLCHGNVEGKQG